MTSDPDELPDGAVRVVRADRGAVLVLPARVFTAAGTAQDGPAEEPRRVVLDRDGLADSDEGRTPPTVGDWLLLDAPLDGREDGPADGTAGGPSGSALDGPLDASPDSSPDRSLDSSPGAAPTRSLDGPRIVSVLPRRTALVRDSSGPTSRTQALAANVDVVLVVEHLDPDPALGRVERLLTLAWRSGARPVVVLTKADLVPDPDGMADDVAQVALGVAVHAVSAQDGRGLEALRRDVLRPGSTLVVVGPSGAGKSTLVNALARRPVMDVGERRADGRGRHTTTHRELVPLADGAVLIDTPGIRGVGVVADADALDTTFADVAELAAACRFGDCRHEREPDCAVRAAIEAGDLPARRLDSWRRLQREAAYQARRSDVRLAAEERARWKRVTQEYQRGMRGPGRPRG